MRDTLTLGSEDASIAHSFALPRIPRATNAGDELEQICKSEYEANVSDAEKSLFPGFPQKCLPIVRLLAGNHCCVDCGDQTADALEYGSIGYGTLLCKDCACRHIINTQEQSEVKSLKDDNWDLHAILSLFEGGNTKMLEFIKDKPRWRAKGKMTGDSKDVISFKQIYLSKAATAYRTNLANKVQILYQSRIEALRREEKQREEKAIRRSMKNRNPFINIFEMNDVAPKDIPGILNNSANIGFRKYAVRPKAQVKEEEEPSSSATYTTDPVQLDLIKERINLRRSMRPSATNEFARRITNDSDAHTNSRPSHDSLHKPYLAQIQSSSSRRRSSDLLVGEVGDHLIQGQDDYTTQFVTDDLRSEDHRNTDKPQIREFWLHNQEEQPLRYNTYAPRSNATLGTYRRLSAVERRGSAGTNESSRSGLDDQQKPQFRLPQID
ncbi:hypothetical protein ACHAXM_002792 [Skeletonema potamos]